MSVCLAYSNAWNLPITEQNTFLNVKVLEYEEEMTHGRRKRSSSVPGMLPSFAAEKQSLRFLTRDTFHSDRTGAQVGPDGPQKHLICHWKSGSSTGTPSGELSVESIDTECDDTPTSRMDSKKQRHGPKKTRPCKGKRERMRRLIDRLNSQVDKNPEAFDIQAVILPVCVGDHEELRKKVLKAVKAHHERALAG